MSDQVNDPRPDEPAEVAPDATEPAVPTRCPDCGTELESATVDFDESKANRPELRPGEMVEVTFCPNPDCPSHARQANQGTVDAPGSLGGDNGGA